MKKNIATYATLPHKKNSINKIWFLPREMKLLNNSRNNILGQKSLTFTEYLALDNPLVFQDETSFNWSMGVLLPLQKEENYFL